MRLYCSTHTCILVSILPAEGRKQPPPGICGSGEGWRPRGNGLDGTSAQTLRRSTAGRLTDETGILLSYTEIICCRIRVGGRLTPPVDLIGLAAGETSCTGFRRLLKDHGPQGGKCPPMAMGTVFDAWPNVTGPGHQEKLFGDRHLLPPRRLPIPFRLS